MSDLNEIPPGTTGTLTEEQVRELQRNTKHIIRAAELSHLCWVDAKDRLPDNTDLCLILITHKNRFSYTLSNYVGGYWVSGPQCFMNVTHWMPLPEPPK